MADARKRISICADDFGLDPAISRTIVELARRGRLTAIGCLTGAPGWPGSAALLGSLPPSIERGLHFNLTEGAPVSAELRRLWPCMPSLPRLMAAALARRLPLTALGCEWQAQWARFVEHVGDAPRFVDGHQHVHHLPGVRDIVLAGLASAGGGAAVRNTGCVLGPGHALKRMLIERSGGRALLGQLQRRGVRHNRVLLGVYDFRDPDYRRCMQRWLASAPAQGALLFCHPGAVDAAAGAHTDPIAPARLRESEYLGSSAFLEDLSAAGIILGPAWD